jgi:hypothetical protein
VASPSVHLDEGSHRSASAAQVLAALASTAQAARLASHRSNGGILVRKTTAILSIAVMLTLMLSLLPFSNSFVTAQTNRTIVKEQRMSTPTSDAATKEAPMNRTVVKEQGVSTVKDEGTQQEQGLSIPANRIDSLIGNMAANRKTQEVIRIFSDGALIENPALAYGLVRQSGRYYPETKTLTIKGLLNGNKVVEDVHFLILDDENLIVERNIYLDGEKADLSAGQGLPFSIEPAGKYESSFSVLAAAAPTISSVGGVSSTVSGISNGKVSMTCGQTANGNYAINDQVGVYPLTIYGNNFGSARGAVSIAGRNSPILSWSNTAIKIDPTLDWWANPMSAVLKITTSSGSVLNSGINIVPAISSRIYGQCTYRVALTRKQLGLQPSPSAYGGYTTISSSYVPRAGDQYQWGGGSHTGIATGVSGPVASAGGIKTWNITISEQNADCRNGLNTYTAQFQTKTVNGSTTVTIKPKSSVTSYGQATLYYR